MSVTGVSPTNEEGAVGLWGSPPCQSYSTAGSGGGRIALTHTLENLAGATHDLPEGARLILEPLRWVRAAMAVGNPYRWIILEQVPGALPVWEGYLKALVDLGYGGAAGVLRFDHYGLPQRRKRAILVARLGETATLPAPTHGARLLDPVSMGKALGFGRTTPEMGMMPAGRSCPGKPRPLDAPSPTITGAGNQVWVRVDDYPDDYSGSSAEKRAKLPPNQETWRVSNQQRAILQGFPRDYPFRGNRAEISQQIGDAVPPPIAEMLVRHVAH